MSRIETLVQGIKDCECGKEHSCPIDIVRIKRGVLGELTQLCENYHRILLVADENTWEVCGAEAFERIREKAEALVLYGNGHVVVPDEAQIARMEARIGKETDLIIGVGSGVINDLCKHVSFQHDLPYYIIATAPSMDGYASVGAALILGGMKVTTNARPPKAILSDPAVLKDAPFAMIQAGWGDIIGKYSCLNDWKLSALIRGEYFCQRVYDLVMDTTKAVEGLAEGVMRKDEDAVCALMEALVIVGIAMSYVGNSRPASGSEHHLSHFFEITGILYQEPYYPHGTDVLYSSVVTARIRELLKQAKPQKQVFDRKDWEQEIHDIYLSSAEGIIKLQDRMGWYEQDDSKTVLAKWDEICKVLAEAPTEAKMRQMVEQIGLSTEDFEVFYGKKKISDGIRRAKDLKDRYSVLWLLEQYHPTVEW